MNSRFINTGDTPDEDNYIGGEPFKSNRLMVSLRSGAGRTEAQYQSMTKALQSIWDEVVEGGDCTGKESEKELKDIFIMGTIDSAMERGWFLPMVRLLFSRNLERNTLTDLLLQPGQFENWVKKNTVEFQKLADEGDPVFKNLAEEIKERSEFH